MTNQHIQTILREGRRLDTPSLRVYYAAALLGAPQSACVVGKKVHASAVVRHRYQRLLRELVRKLHARAVRYDMVVVAKPAILTHKKLPQLQAELEPHLEKLLG